MVNQKYFCVYNEILNECQASQSTCNSIKAADLVSMITITILEFWISC